MFLYFRTYKVNFITIRYRYPALISSFMCKRSIPFTKTIRKTDLFFLNMRNTHPLTNTFKRTSQIRILDLNARFIYGQVCRYKDVLNFMFFTRKMEIRKSDMGHITVYTRIEYTRKYSRKSCKEVANLFSDVDRYENTLGL